MVDDGVATLGDEGQGCSGDGGVSRETDAVGAHHKVGDRVVAPFRSEDEGIGTSCAGQGVVGRVADQDIGIGGADGVFDHRAIADREVIGGTDAGKLALIEIQLHPGHERPRGGHGKGVDPASVVDHIGGIPRCIRVGI